MFVHTNIGFEDKVGSDLHFEIESKLYIIVAVLIVARLNTYVGEHKNGSLSTIGQSDFIRARIQHRRLFAQMKLHYTWEV